MKFLIIFCSALSAQAALAIPLLFNVSHTTTSLLVDSSVDQLLTIDEFVINPVKSKVHSKSLSVNLSELLQNKTFDQLNNELQHKALAYECSAALVHSWINATYQQYFQQQKSVYSALQAQKNASFHGQNGYQAEQQKIALFIS